MVLSKLFIIIAKIIIVPPINTLDGGISFRKIHTQRGAKIVSVSINKPMVTDFVDRDPIVMQINPNVSCGTPNKNPINISLFEKLNASIIINE